MGGFFPSLKRRGARDINKKFPFRSEAAGVVSSAKGLKTHSDTFRRADHPGCAISVASRLFVSAQPPLLFKEGKASCPHFSRFIATFLLESLVQKWPISRASPRGRGLRQRRHAAFRGLLKRVSEFDQ